MTFAELMESRQVGAVLTLDDLASLPTVLTAEAAFRALGIGLTLGYQLIRDGEFPVDVLRLGSRAVRIPVLPLLHVLGLEIERSNTEPDGTSDRVE